MSGFGESIERYGKKNLGLGMEMIRDAYRKLERLPTPAEDSRLMQHLLHHDLTTAEIEDASKNDIEAWITPTPESVRMDPNEPLRDKWNFIPEDAVSTLEGLVSNFSNIIDNFGLEKRQAGMEMIQVAYRKLGRLPSLVEDDRLMKHIQQHNLTTEDIKAASKANIKAWIAPPAEAVPPSATGKARTNGRKKS